MATASACVSRAPPPLDGGDRVPVRRLRFTSDQRRRLAAKGRPLGRRRLEDLAGIVSPETLLLWYRELIAKKYDGSARCGAGRQAPASASRSSECCSIDIWHQTEPDRGLAPDAVEVWHQTRSRFGTRRTQALYCLCYVRTNKVPL